MSADQPEITSRSRYPGSKPFTTAQKDLFFGRDNDIRNLHSMVLVKQLVVLYGKSGFGKSSLINAGIVPKLITENKYQCFSVRFNNFHTNDINNKMPVETVIDWIKSSSPINFKSPLTILTHGENTFWYWIKTLQWNNRSQPFILFFDQFEELFTYPPAEIEAFSKNLAEVLYIPIPVKYRNELAILDEKGELEDDFHDFLYDIPNIKIVLSIRSDRLSLLNNLTEQHSSIFQNCYELAPLTKKQAEEAIDKPSQLTGDYDTPSFQYTREAILKVINGIASKSDGTIETAMLQILCIYVEDILVLGQKKILIEGEDLGNITDIFQKYYEETLGKLNDKEREMAQELIEEKLISEDLRNSLPGAYIMHEFHVTATLLDFLEKTSLLRKERDAQGRFLYELSHDTLLAPIRKVAKVRLDREKAEKLALAETETRRKQKEAEARVKELENLNQQVQRRSNYAWTLFAIALIVLVFAAYSYNKANNETEKANENLKTAKIFYEQTNQKEAQRLIGIANSYMEYDEYQLALDNLLKAKSALKVDFDSYQKKAEFKSSTGQSSMLNIQEIEAKILLCKQFIKKSSNENRD